MLQNNQTRGVSILQHGLMVYNSTINHILPGYVIPEWFNISSLTPHINMNIIAQYTVLHDCGKPYCVVIDEQGRRHFPDHAKISTDTFREYFNNVEVEALIRDDMWLHTCSSEDAHNVRLTATNYNHYIALLIVAFAEIHANASMFGGIESVSYKIKYKHLCKRGKVLFNKITAFISDTNNR